MQDEVRDKSMALFIKVGKTGGKLTADLLKWAIRRYQAQQNNPKIHHGRQTVKQLVGQGGGVQNIEITEKNIKSFERVARKYGVDFALKKDPGQGKYLVFFKVRDEAALQAAFTEYAAKTLNRRPKKPSLRKQLTHFKDLIAHQTRDTMKNREKGAWNCEAGGEKINPPQSALSFPVLVFYQGRTVLPAGRGYRRHHQGNGRTVRPEDAAL